jgi:hypothetical protein
MKARPAAEAENLIDKNDIIGIMKNGAPHIGPGSRTLGVSVCCHPLTGGLFYTCSDQPGMTGSQAPFHDES